MNIQTNWLKIFIAIAIGLAILAADLPFNQRVKSALQRLEAVKIIEI